MISSSGEVNPLFGPGNQVLFRFTEGSAYYLGAMNPDGTGRRKFLPMKLLNVNRVSPDRRFLTAATELAGSPNREPGAIALNLETGTWQKISSSYFDLDWSPDGRYFYMEIQPPSREDPEGKTAAIPIPPGRSLPVFPPAAVAHLTAWMKQPGVKIVRRAEIAPGPTPSIYAYIEPSIHANLFRIPLR